MALLSIFAHENLNQKEKYMGLMPISEFLICS